MCWLQIASSSDILIGIPLKCDDLSRERKRAAFRTLISVALDVIVMPTYSLSSQTPCLSAPPMIVFILHRACIELPYASASAFKASSGIGSAY